MAEVISSSRPVFIGVDVVTGSARAGVFDGNGKLLGFSSSPIQIWKEGDFIEQSSTDIWLAVSAAVRSACSLSDVDGEDVTGIGFAATCSLVAVDADGSPVTVSRSGDPRRNIIVWMDDRPVKQAERINSSHSPVLQYCGGALSPEMEPPKRLWVKENLKESWSMAFRWMDLSDWLSYNASGDNTRTLCSIVCKCTYLGHAHMDQLSRKGSCGMEACGWDDDFWQETGLGDLVDGHHAKIGRSVAFLGHPLGSGLTSAAAKELGLLDGTPVGTFLVDAHAGGVGVMETPSSDVQFQSMITECWLTEGGQSATGALLGYVIENHVASPLLVNKAASCGTSVFTVLNLTLESMMLEKKSSFLAALTIDLHFLPDFQVNRSPCADPTSKGMVSGLTLDTSEKDLALHYLATVQGIAYGTWHILEHCNAHGHKIDTLLACGGLAKNPLYIQEHADITGRPLADPCQFYYLPQRYPNKMWVVPDWRNTMDTPFVFLADKPKDADDDGESESESESESDSTELLKRKSSTDMSEEDNMVPIGNRRKRKRESDCFDPEVKEKMISIYSMEGTEKTLVSWFNLEDEMAIGFNSLCKSIKRVFPHPELRVASYTMILWPWYPHYGYAEYISSENENMDPLAMYWDTFKARLDHVRIRRGTEGGEYIHVKRLNGEGDYATVCSFPKSACTTSMRLDRILYFFQCTVEWDGCMEPMIAQPLDPWAGSFLTYRDHDGQELNRPDGGVNLQPDDVYSDDVYSDDGAAEYIEETEVAEVVNPVGEEEIQQNSEDEDAVEDEEDTSEPEEEEELEEEDAAELEEEELDEEGAAESSEEDEELDEEWKFFFEKLHTVEVRAFRRD